MLKALIPVLIKSMSAIVDPTSDTDQLQWFDSAGENYNSDCSLFEMCCYVVFRVDLWHVQTDPRSFTRDLFYGVLFPNC